MLELRHRRRLRKKEVRKLADDLWASLGVRTLEEEDAVDLAEGPRFSVVVFENKAFGMVVDGVPFLTVRGLLRWPPAKRHLSVDEGAIRFLCNGADVMGPGIVEADPSIQPDQLVWVRDARHRKPLVVGRALVSGEGMAARSPGKAVKNLHHVGDELWGFGVEE